MRTVACTVMVGSIRDVWCEHCQSSARVHFDLVGVTEDGVRVLGQFEICQTCGTDEWRCGPCGAVVAGRVEPIMEHLRDVHAAASEGPGGS